MIVYHISDTLAKGDTLENGRGHFDRLAEPFIQALEMGQEWFRVMLLQGNYMFQVMSRSGLREWADYVKWSTEAVFEYIRRREFPHCPSRLSSCYYYDSVEQCRKLYWDDWGGESPEVRAKIHLFAVELEEDAPCRYDMNIFDLAYTAIEERQDTREALAQARRYFSGAGTADAVWEILSSRPARAVETLALEA